MGKNLDCIFLWMDTLAQLRKKIDTLDDDIITLLAQRFSLVTDI